MAPARPRPQDMGLFGIVALAWGLNYLFVREGLTLAAPLWLALLRSGVGALGLLPFLLLRRAPTHLTARERRDALLLGLPNTAVFFGLWFVAAASVPPGETAVIVYTFPLWVAVLTAGLFQRRLGAALWVAIGVAFLGIALISQPWKGGTSALPALSVAELLLAALCWALGTVLIQRRFAPSLLPEANGYQLAGGSAVLLAAALLVEPGSVPVPSLRLLATVAWLGLVGTALAYGIWFYLLGRFDAPRLSAFTFLVPVVALVASVLLLGERLVPLQVLGVLVVFGAIFVIARLKGNNPDGPLPAEPAG